MKNVWIMYGDGGPHGQTAARRSTHRHSMPHNQDKTRQMPLPTSYYQTKAPVQPISALTLTAAQPTLQAGLKLHDVYVRTTPIQLHASSTGENAGGQGDQRAVSPKRALQSQT